MQHIINKQVIELSLTKQQDAFSMQHIVSSHYYSELLPLLEKVFNQYSTEGEVLVFDKLEIDLGTIPQNDIGKVKWDDSVLSSIELKIEESLISFLENNTAVRKPLLMNDCRQWMFYMQHGYLGWNTLCINAQWHNNVLAVLATDYAGITLLRNLIAKQQNTAYRIAMQHEEDFLKNLTAILTTKNQQNLIVAIDEIALLCGKLAAHDNLPLPVSESLKKRLWQQVITTASSAPDNLSTDKIITALLYPYMPQLAITSTQWQAEVLPPFTAIQPMLMQLWQSINNTAIAHPGFESKNPFYKNDGFAKQQEDTSGNRADDAGSSLSQQDDEAVTKNLNGPAVPGKPATTGSGGKKSTDNKASATSKDGGVPAQDKSFISPDIGYMADGKISIANEEGFVAATKKTTEDEAITDGKNTGTASGGTNQIINGITAVAGNIDSNKNDAVLSGSTSGLPENSAIKMPGNLLFTEKPFTENFGDNQSLCNDIPKDGIFIVNAGIVLAHSFISFLFKRLSLVEANNFKDADAQIKAIFLLHYLSTGNTTAAEHELVLCKLLCAYPINSPIPAEQFLLPVELEEANDMLIAVLQQWDKLQSTSIAGLRESFLQRKGKIFTKGERAIIQVEQSSIDILLDYLPWNLSIIKLPWMKEIVHVEWR